MTGLRPPHREQAALQVDVSLGPSANGVLTKDSSRLDSVCLFAETHNLRLADEDVTADHSAVAVEPTLAVAVPNERLQDGTPRTLPR